MSKQTYVQRMKILKEKVIEIDEQGEGLSEWEIDFIDDMLKLSVYTEKQAAQVERIHKKCFEDEEDWKENFNDPFARKASWGQDVTHWDDDNVPF